MRRVVVLGLLLLLTLIPATQAQDGLNLPTELYILRNEGRVERYGIGTVGVSAVTPEDEFVLDFRVAPDGNWLAYRTQSGLFLDHMYIAGQSRQIEDQRASVPALRGRGETIAWSPRSEAIAYTTEYGARVHFFEAGAFSDIIVDGLFNLLWSQDGRFLAAEAALGVWWIYRVEGNEMLLAAAIPGSNGLTWISGSQAIFAPPEGGLVLLDLNAGNNQTTIIESSAQYYLPKFLQDNRLRVFTGEPNRATMQEVTFVGGTPEVNDAGIGAIDPANVSWSPDGNLLTAFQGGVLALIDPASGSGFTLPITSAAAYSWGPTYPPPATGQPLPASGTFLAPDANGIRQIWRLPADGSRAVILSSALDSISEYQLSPDDRRAVYISNSSLWVSSISEAQVPVELVQLGINENVTPAWSADGSTIYYRDEQASGSGIWQINLDEEDASLFLPDSEDTTYTKPQPASGVAAMLVNRNDELVIVDTTSGAQNALGVQGDGQWLTGTQLVANGTLNDLRALYLFDANAPENPPTVILPLLGELTLLDYQLVDEAVIRVLVRTTNPGELRMADIPRTGGLPSVIATPGYLTDPSLSPDGSAVVGYTHPDGSLIIFDLNTTRRRIIDTLPQVTGFQW